MPSSEYKASMPKMKLGFIGGGVNSAVGYTHVLASQLDGCFDLVAGCFSRDAGTNQASAEKFQVSPERCYASVDDLLASELGKLDAVCVLAPTPDHAELVAQSLRSGFNVICEKALVTSISEADDIAAVLKTSGRELLVTFNYVGYPMVREARAMIAAGAIGTVQQIFCEMPQESFARAETNPQDWRRQDYEIPCVSLDLGVHVCHMVNFVAGRADLQLVSGWEGSFGKINNVIDTVCAIATYGDDSLVNLMWGKAALGNPNGLKFRIFGDRGSIEWHQAAPETLLFSNEFGARRTLERGQPDLLEANKSRYNRFKAGHPAGFVEAFANIYEDFHNILAGDISDSSYSSAEASRGLRFLSDLHQKAA